jgi:hypothetical protein
LLTEKITKAHSQGDAMETFIVCQVVDVGVVQESVSLNILRLVIGSLSDAEKIQKTFGFETTLIRLRANTEIYYELSAH